MVFFFNDTATTEIYTLSLHDALPISLRSSWINIEKWRLRQIAKVVDDDFLLFGIIQVKPAYHDAVDYLTGTSPAFRWRSGNDRRRSRRSFPGTFFRGTEQFST